MQQIARVLPPAEFPIVDIPLIHPIMHTLYDVKAIPQVSSINFWYPKRPARRPSAAATAPRSTSAASRTRTAGLMVLMSHNTDIADTLGA